MTSFTTRQFRELFAKLPEQVQRQARSQYRLFRHNPRHRSLQFKRVHTRAPVFSARVNDNYRVLGMVDADTIVWYWIGGHAQYEALLKRH